MLKYPRTPHLQGSRRQPGDEGLDDVSFKSVAGKHTVIEEKVDGANAAIHFDASGHIHLQSRGHILTGGPRERQFDLFKSWARVHQEALWNALASRYVMYGEWCYARHTIFYDKLPHYFLEFDVYDRDEEQFLSTPRRQTLSAGLPIVSVPILHEGRINGPDDLHGMIGPSRFKTPQWREHMEESCHGSGLDSVRAMADTDPSNNAEGLYVKVEHDGNVTGRYKFIRESFLSVVAASDDHWMNKPLVPNLLAAGIDIFSVPS